MARMTASPNRNLRHPYLSPLKRLVEQVPHATTVGAAPTNLPEGWASTDTSLPLVAFVGAGFTVDDLARVVLERQPDDLWVVFPNPYTTDDLLRLLQGQRVATPPVVIADIDQAIPPGYRWLPARTEGDASQGAPSSGLGALLDQLASENGIAAGPDPVLTRRYVRQGGRLADNADGEDPPAPTVTEAPSARTGSYTAGPDEGASPRTPFLSVLVRTQGSPIRLETLRDTLLCLMAQTDQNFEVLLLPHRVDPTTLATIRALCAEHADLCGCGIRVHPVVEPGRAAPLTEGLQVAVGDYVAVLDDDDTVMAHWVQTFVELASESQRPAVLHSRGLLQRMEIHGGDATAYRAWTPWESVWKPGYDLINQWVDNHMPIHTYALPRREVLAWGLRWDAKLPVLEDWDLLMRAIDVLGCVSGPEHTAIYRMWPAAQASLGTVSQTGWDTIRSEILDGWNRRVWLAPPGTVAHAREAEFARLAAGTSGERLRRRASGWARRFGPLILSTPFGPYARKLYRRSGLRPDPAD